MGIFVISKHMDNHFQFDLKTDNHHVLLTSQVYLTRSSCELGVESVKSNSQNDAHIDRKTSTNRKPYFNLRSEEGLVIGTSERFETNASMENGIASLKRNTLNATLEG